MWVEYTYINIDAAAQCTHKIDKEFYINVMFVVYNISEIVRTINDWVNTIKQSILAFLDFMTTV